MKTGLAVGKFWPPHLGHHLLINRVTEMSDRMVVVVCAAATQIPSGSCRAIWMQAIHPQAEVVVVEDLCAWHHPEPCLEECSGLWAGRIDQLGLGRIDLVGTSEPYGELFAKRLGSEHLAVDPHRTQVPISSSAVRRDLSANWSQLHRVVKSGLVRRVVVLGAESTGTSTLARHLAHELCTSVTAEAGRTVSWELFSRSGNDMTNVPWTEQTFWEIVDKQVFLEHHAVQELIASAPGSLGPWMVGDTDTLATVAWWERYLNTESTAIHRLSSARLADLYLLTDPSDVPFDDSDPLRDGAEIRTGMHRRMIELLEDCGRPWHLVTGSPAERLTMAVDAVRHHEVSHPRWVHH